MRALLLALLAAPVGAIAAPATPVSVDGVSEAIASAGEDVGKLAALADRWTAENDGESARLAWRRIVEIDSYHAGARAGLRHHLYEGRWYETYAALSRARRDEARRRLEEDGVVPFGDEWVKPEDLPFRRMGWERLDDGAWAPPGTREARAEVERKVSLGWEQQHRTWISPDEFDRWRAGLWKVGDEWLDADAANEAHAEIGAWWEVPGEHFVALTTVTEERSRWVVWWADRTHDELVRLFGLEPREAPELVVLNSIAQYNDFAAGSAAASRVPADSMGWSSIHYAFFTDGWIDRTGSAPAFRGTGAAYYAANDPALEPFGQHAVRHAAAIAWLAAVDPSWDTVSRMLTEPAAGFPDASYWDEKRIPRWMQYGAASYCERYFEDATVGEDGDPLWSRKWALDNLRGGGPLPPVKEILTLDFDTADPPASARRIHLAGLLVHFAADGGDPDVTEAFDAFRAALVAGEDTADSVAALEAELVDAQSKIARFAGL
ncbi:MAG: hypothetical protein AAGA20_19570 [Planctomycetota bacterium]